jgi:hypothetical protein
MLYREIIAVCSEIHTNHIKTLCGQNVYLKTQPVPRIKHFSSRLQKQVSLCYIGKNSLFVLRQIQNKQTECGNSVQLLNVKTGGTFSNH